MRASCSTASLQQRAQFLPSAKTFSPPRPPALSSKTDGRLVFPVLGCDFFLLASGDPGDLDSVADHVGRTHLTSRPLGIQWISLGGHGQIARQPKSPHGTLSPLVRFVTMLLHTWRSSPAFHWLILITMSELLYVCGDRVFPARTSATVMW